MEENLKRVDICIQKLIHLAVHLKHNIAHQLYFNKDILKDAKLKNKKKKKNPHKLKDLISVTKWEILGQISGLTMSQWKGKFQQWKKNSLLVYGDLFTEY